MQGLPAIMIAGLNKRDGRLVIDGLGVHGADDGEIVRHFRDVGQQLGDPGAALAMLRKLEDGGAMGNRLWPEVMVVSR